MKNEKVRIVYYFFLAMSPTILMFYFLIKYFPYTGLGRILALPYIFCINAGLIITGFNLIRKFRRKRRIFAWSALIAITVLLTIGLHPQEGRSNVYKQLWDSAIAISEYEGYTLNDLDRPIHHRADEGYVVALYKFREQIPLDGSFHVYRENVRGTHSYYDTSINSLKEIPEKLKAHHKLIWRTLEWTK